MSGSSRALHSDVTQDLVLSAARRWGSSADVRALTIVQGVDVSAVGLGDGVERHLALIGAMPGRGRLAVDSGECEDRVLRLETSALAVTLARGAAISSEVDGWMARVDAACSQPPPGVWAMREERGQVTGDVPLLVLVVEQALGYPVLGLRFLPSHFS